MAGTGSNQNSLTSTSSADCFYGDDDSSVLPSNRQRTKKWSWIFTPQISAVAVVAVVVAVITGFAGGVAVADARVIHPDRVQVDFLGFVSADSSSPDTFSTTNLDDKSTRVLLQVEGRFEPGTTAWKVTTDPGLCTPHPELDSPLGRMGVAGGGHEYESVAASVASVPVVSAEPATHLAGKEVYLCARDASKSAVSSPDSEEWTVVDKILLPQLQEDLILNGGSSPGQAAFGGVNDNRYRRQSGNEENGDSSKSSENQPEKSTESTISQPVNGPSPQAEIFGLHLNEVTHKVSYSEDGVISALAGHKMELTVVGARLNDMVRVYLVSEEASNAGQLQRGDRCLSKHLTTSPGWFNITVDEHSENIGTMHIPKNKLFLKGTYFLCVKDNSKTENNGETDLLIHQGTANNLKIVVNEDLIPIWFKIIILAFLLCLSGLFSGLNLGLMALDQTELRIVQNTGDDTEREYANKIFPIRKHGNYLLCSLLLGNVLVNNSLTILLDTLTSGVVAIIGSTLGIVIFGEIVPQSICSRYALAVGANTIWCTKFFMVVTFPLSYPISIILDKILGDEIGTVYDKKKLIELLKVTDANHDLEKEEVDIVTGALKYKEKSIKQIMTRIEDVYMLQLTSVLNFETVSEIRDQGYSRIPVYDKSRTDIVHILFAKDLMFIDPDDNMPLAMVCEFYNNEVNFVFHDTPLNVMFNEFKSGEKGHMAFVTDVNNTGDGDPYYETIGLVTLEDIIEEIIQQEIVDETDVVVDNRTKKRRKREKGNFAMISGNPAVKKVQISPQLTLAVFQYLATQVDPFKSDHLEEMVLKKLLSLDVYREIKYKSRGKVQEDDDLTIIKKGKPVNYFIMIVEGKVNVTIGGEELEFEAGPFSYYGIKALTQVTRSMAAAVDGKAPGPLMMSNVNSANALMESPSSPFATRSALSMNSVNSKAAQELVDSGTANPGTNTPAAPSAGGPTAQNTSGVGGGVTGPGGKTIRKASTRDCLETANIPGLQKRPSMVSATAGSVAGGGAGGGGPPPGALTDRLQAFVFVPDYTVKAITDVLYVRITRTTYMRAIKASLMASRKQSGHTVGSIGGGLLNSLGLAGTPGPSQMDTIEKELDTYLDRVGEDDLEGETLMATPMARSPDRSAVRRGVGSSSVGPASSGESGGDKKSFVPVSASNNSSVGRQSSSTAALPSNIAPASLPTQLAAAETSSRKQPGQTISSPQSGADNDNTVNAGNTSRETLPAADDDFWESGRGGGGVQQKTGEDEGTTETGGAGGDSGGPGDSNET